MTTPAAALLVCIGTAIATAGVVMASGEAAALVVIAFFALYLIGGAVFMPWKTPLRHAFSAGVLLGMTAAGLFLIYQYNSR
jgi:hypothetical protein